MSSLSMNQLRSLRGLRGLGDDTSACGPQPDLQAGETLVCCPNVGWVAYGAGESTYGICERALAQIQGGSAGSTSTTTLSSDPVERVAQLRAQLDAQREAAEERRFQQQVQELQLRFVLGQMQAVQSAEAARQAAQAAAQASERSAALKAAEAKLQGEKTKKVLTWGALALAAAKVFALI